ncbi:MAG: glycosyltransferase family 4 protein [Kiritimatiellae bacterium]|nr:glycosyltransferase family 4 protein [Kiritimatiellia bacterium]
MSKILILVERFYPEDFLVNDLASEWKRMGHDVEVLTQVPSYPFDKIFNGYKNKTYQTTSEFNDIPVHRVSTIFGYNTSVKRKVLNYLHFALLTSLWALWNGSKFDRVFVYHTAALTMASAVVPLKWLWRKPITIWTQDLWPDAVWGFGFKPSKWKSALLNAFVRFIYARCDRITVSCRRYVKRIKELTGRDAEWIPQWEPSGMELSPKDDNGKAVFMFAGNMGVPQNLDNVIAGFERAALTDAELWLVGGGVMLEPLKEKFGGVKGVRFCGRQPRADMPKWFAQADVLIISLTDQYCLTLPGKFQSYIKTGKPLLGIINGEARELIEEHEIGFTAAPDDINAISDAYRKLHQVVRSGESLAYGERARALSKSMFNRAILVNRLLDANEECQKKLT